MKLINGGIALIVASVLFACGGSSKNESVSAGDTAVVDSTTVAEPETLEAGAYANEKLGYSITYPKDILVLQSETENTDEQVFLAKEGNAKLRIYKDIRKDKSGKVLTFNEAFELDRGTTSKRQVSYSSLKPLFYAVSGVEGKEIFYQKTIMAKGDMVTAKLTYMKEDKPTYDAMIATLFDSFK
ncbi:MAG: hypothetical protein E6772_02175 [Dysgonomonas sp.]|nr:hypothetical protein [Dysgonomonas sp.]